MRALKILLLEDDVMLVEIIEEFLLSLGYDVTVVLNGKAAEEVVYEQRFDLFILDVNVPYVNGFEFLKSLRALKNMTPAIFITSLSDPKDMKEGFAVGADDYIKKPFDLSELELRINNIKRHFNLESKHIMIDEDITLDMENLTIMIGEQIHTLAQKDAEVLRYLVEHHAHLVSLEELGVNIWDYECVPSDATLRTYIKNIRKIIGEEYITNVKGVGYRFNKK
jgi:DNA-binding response OmpR family regulator